jgi:ribosomal protein S18 acetylase RimI-like enzyme
MKYFYLIYILIFILVVSLIYYLLQFPICSHKKILNKNDINIIKKYLDQEYETASKYLYDEDIIHFFIIKDDVLLSYFHVSEYNIGENYISYSYTNPNYRGKGYAKKLLQYGLSICREYNINKLYSFTKVNNTVSINLFKSCGFKIDSIDNDEVNMSYKHN